MVNIDECLVFYIFWLQTVTESTWKILKLDWKTPEFFSSKRVGTLLHGWKEEKGNWPLKGSPEIPCII